MDSSSSHQSDGPKPKRLKTLASDVKFSEGNVLLHEFVLDNSHPNDSGSENYLNAVLLSMSDVPSRVVNAHNDDGFSALHLAVLKNNLLMVRKLLSCLINIDVDARCDMGEENTPLHLAVECGYLSIVQVLLDKGADIDIKNGVDETALALAASLGDLDAMKLLVSKDADVNSTSTYGTPICYAAETGNLEAVEFLVSNGAVINLRNEANPLCSAAESGHLAIVEVLVRNGADVNIRDEKNETPLHYAVKLSDTKIAEYLLRNGADINAESFAGETPLHSAARGRGSGHAGFLFDLGHSAVNNVQFLLDQGADINAKNFENETPLHCAVRGRNSVIGIFLQFSSVWKRHDAVRQVNLGIVKLLIDQGADLRAIDKDGETPFHEAVYMEDFKIMAFLSDQGEGPHADRGWNPYADAEYRGHAKVIRLLLDRGADVNAKNENGETPFDLARNQSCIDALQKLEQE